MVYFFFNINLLEYFYSCLYFHFLQLISILLMSDLTFSRFLTITRTRTTSIFCKPNKYMLCTMVFLISSIKMVIHFFNIVFFKTISDIFVKVLSILTRPTFDNEKLRLVRLSKGSTLAISRKFSLCYTIFNCIR